MTALVRKLLVFLNVCYKSYIRCNFWSYNNKTSYSFWGAVLRRPPALEIHLYTLIPCSENPGSAPAMNNFSSSYVSANVNPDSSTYVSENF